MPISATTAGSEVVLGQNSCRLDPADREQDEVRTESPASNAHGALSTPTWTQFVRSQTVVACDFATIHTTFLRRYSWTARTGCGGYR